MVNWNKLTQIKKYIDENKEKGITAFGKLLESASQKKAELIVLSFTYENLEAYVKVNGDFKLCSQLFGVLSQYEMDQLRMNDYNENNHYEEYEYQKFNDVVWYLIEVWMLNCYKAALKKQEGNNIKCYFKRNVDSLEILELNTCSTKFEKSEFELFIKNSEKNVMTLLDI